MREGPQVKSLWEQAPEDLTDQLPEEEDAEEAVALVTDDVMIDEWSNN